MASILIVGIPQEARKLASHLASEGYATSLAPDLGEALNSIRAQPPDLILLDMAANLGDGERIEEWLNQTKGERPIPVAALVPEERLRGVETPRIDDFSLLPYKPLEVMTRIRRLLRGGPGAENRDLVLCGELSLDLAKYEVYVEGRAVDLTFKEFQLLRFLATHPGRVYTREALLSHVWGYDYYGGTRTVDVHIRRIRGKIEDANHTFIETVRNVGYMFKT